MLGDAGADPAKVARVLLCTGKIYYDLVEERAKRKDDSVAIVRLEKLYPWWPQLVAAETTERFPVEKLYWVQDEPVNMGAGTFTPRLHESTAGKPIAYRCISRAESASPATGSHKAHVMEEQQILAEAFG